MILSADHSFMRRTNQRSMLEVLFKNKELSRADLARLLNLSKPAVADNILPLILNGVVKEIGEARASENGGRKPVMLRINKNHKYIVAIDLNHNNPLFVLGNLVEEKLDEFSVKVSVKTSYSQRMDIIKNAISLLLDAHNLSSENLCCIALSMPGVLAEDNKAFVNPQFAGWFEGDLIHDISEKFDDVPIIVKNDANTAALGELTHGEYIDATNLLYVTCGIGIGTGIILNRQLFEGKKNMAGEIFNFIDSRMARSNENLEDQVRIDKLLEKIKKKLSEKSHSILRSADLEDLELEDVVDAYQKHDPLVLEILEEAALEVACAVANICNLLTIDTVVFGGEYVVFKDTFLKKMNEITAKYCIVPPKVLVSQLGKYAGIYGLFSMARSNYFDMVSNMHNDWEYV